MRQGASPERVTCVRRRFRRSLWFLGLVSLVALSTTTGCSEGSFLGLSGTSMFSSGDQDPPMPRFAPIIYKGSAAAAFTDKVSASKTSDYKPLPIPSTKDIPEARTAPSLRRSEAFKKSVAAYYGKGRQVRLMIQTDKPLYKPGETIWVRTVEVFTKENHTRKVKEAAIYELVNPRGVVIKKTFVFVDKGHGHHQFRLPRKAVGGPYTIRVKNPYSKSKGEKAIVVNAYQAPRIKKKLEFIRKGYGPGDTVNATLRLRRGIGGPFAGQQVSLLAKIDGLVFKQWSATSDSKGKIEISFALPKKLNSEDGSLTAMVRDAGVVESISRPIPLLVKKIDVGFFAEGGTAIMGLPSRMYIHVRKKIDQKPQDIEGEIIEKSGKVVAKVKTFHDGMGRFVYTPEPDKLYALVIKKPLGFEQKFVLPAAKAKGVTIQSVDDFRSQRKDLQLVVHSQKAQRVVLTALQYETLVGHRTFQLKRGKQLLTLPLKHQWRGIVRLTLFDRGYQPLAERLLFRHRGKGLQVKVITDKKSYQPRQTVNLKVRVTDPAGNAIPDARLGVSVVDDRTLSFADDHEPHFLSQRFLTQQLAGKIHKPNYYFDEKQPKSWRALDLVMGTHGWRGFSWREVASAKKPPVLASLSRYQYNRYRWVQFRRYRWRRQRLARRRRMRRRLARRRKMGLMGLLNAGGGRGGGGLALGGARPIVKGAFGKGAFGKGALAPAPPVVVRRRARPRRGGRAAFANKPREIRRDPLAVAAAPRGKKRVYGRGGMNMKGKAGKNLVLRGPAPRPSIKQPPAPQDKAGEKMAGGAKKEAAPALQQQKVGDIAKDADDAMPKQAKAKKKRATRKPARRPAPRMRRRPKKRRVARRWRGRLRWRRNRRRRRARRVRWTFARVFPTKFYNQKKPFTGTRTDFRDTIYWNPMIKTDTWGEAKVKFGLNDGITTFRVRVAGVGKGMVAMKDKVISSKRPFFMVVKLPLEVSAGDALALPLTLRNRTKKPIELKVKTRMSRRFKLLENPLPKALKLAAGEARTYFYPVRVVSRRGTGFISFKASAKGISDSFRRVIKIKPRGFPREKAWAGTLNGKKSRTFVLNLPKDIRSASPRASLTLYPNPLSSMIKGMASMIRAPYGCFEQASSSNYPNVMIVSYLRSRKMRQNAIMKRAYAYLDSGYRRLVGFETKRRGYEWFGHSPGHEALTAYGLLQFTEMRRIYPKVSRTMIRRTSQWLLARRNGKGGFLRNSKALDTFGRADQHITDAYITFALAEAGRRDINQELRALEDRALGSKDPYFVSLVSNAILKVRGRDKVARRLIDNLTGMQQKDGSFHGKRHSITRSYGKNLNIETTALATLAMLRGRASAQRSLHAIRWIRKQRSRYGGFGTTQATILALRAIIAFDKANRSTKAPGTIKLFVNGKLREDRSFSKAQVGDITLKSFAKYLRPGRNILKIQYSSKMPLPFGMGVRYYTKRPVSHKNMAVKLTTKLAKEKLKMGEIVRLTATIENTKDEGIPMTLARISFPGALRFQTWQLKDLIKKKVVGFYETNAREVIVYFRALGPRAKKVIHLDLVARVTGNFTGSASSSYLYYTNDKKHWTNPLKVSVTP